MHVCAAGQVTGDLALHLGLVADQAYNDIVCVRRGLPDKLEL